MSDYGPQVKLARLYERTSKKTGNQYFTRRLGAAKVARYNASLETADRRERAVAEEMR